MRQADQPAAAECRRNRDGRQRPGPGQAGVEEGRQRRCKRRDQAGPQEQEGGLGRDRLGRQSDDQHQGDQADPAAPCRPRRQPRRQRQADGDERGPDDDRVVEAAEGEGRDSGGRKGQGGHAPVGTRAAAQHGHDQGEDRQGCAGLHPRQAGQEGVIALGAVGTAGQRPHRLGQDQTGRREPQTVDRAPADLGQGQPRPAPGPPRRRREQSGRQHQQAPARGRRMAEDHPSEQVGVDGVDGPGRQGLRPQQGVRALQRLRADVLDGAAIEGLGGRVAVVLRRPSDEGQVQALDAAVAGDGEVGAVRHPLIDEDRQRVGGDAAVGAHAGAAEQGDGFGVAPPGLEHHGPAAAAARLQINHCADAIAKGMAAPEDPGPVQSDLLGVGEQHHQRPVRRAARPDRPHGLQHRRHTGRIVRRPGRRRHGVIVGHQGHGGQGRVATRQHADQIGRGEVRGLGIAAHAPQIARRPARDRPCLGRGLEPQIGHSLKQQGLDPGVVGGTDRMRPAGHLAHIGHGPPRRKGGRRRVAADGRRNLQRHDPDQQRQRQRPNQPQQPHETSSPMTGEP